MTVTVICYLVLSLLEVLPLFSAAVHLFLLGARQLEIQKAQTAAAHVLGCRNMTPSIHPAVFSAISFQPPVSAISSRNIPGKA